MFTRYKNLAFLVLLLAAQLILLAYQIRTNQEMTAVRGWAVTAVTPLAQGLEFLRANSFGLAERYIFLTKVEEEREALRKEVDRLKLENQFLRNELSTSDRAKALAAFQQRSRSRTLAARVIGIGAGANSKVVFIDRGKQDGILRGMAVITPDGIVGKITYVFPSTSQVLLITDPTFAAGVISQKNRVPGTLKGMGRNQVKVDYIQNEVRVDDGEWFFTSGDDRVFPKGLPAGQVRVIRNGSVFREIYLDPSGLLRGLEEVLIVTEGVHEAVPEGTLPPEGPLFMMNPPPVSEGNSPSAAPSIYVPSTDADKTRQRIEKIGELQGVDFGTGGKRLPNFNMDPNQVSRPAEPIYVPPLPKPKPATPNEGGAGTGATAGTGSNPAMGNRTGGANPAAQNSPVPNPAGQNPVVQNPGGEGAVRPRRPVLPGGDSTAGPVSKPLTGATPGNAAAAPKPVAPKPAAPKPTGFTGNPQNLPPNNQEEELED